MSGRTSSRVVVCALSALLLASAGALAPAQAAPDAAAALTATGLTPSSATSGAKSAASRLARTDPALLARTDSAPVTVMIKLDHDGTASYAGGVAGLAATSPGVTGTALTGTSAVESAYRRYQQSREDAVVADLRAAVPSARVGQRLRTVYGGIAATIPASSVEAVLAIDGVTAVQSDTARQLLTDSSAAFLNTPPVYAALGSTADAGRGVIYGNLDSGVWPEHPSLADQGNLAPPPGPARACDFGDNPLTSASDPFVCQKKLIGGQPFLATYLSDPVRSAAEPFTTARDSNGHGTHTTTTSAGNIVSSVSVLGSPKPPIHGMAPGAWVMSYKVCGIQGCFSSDSAAAVSQAILDGVDVINFSISGGTDPFTDPVELAFLDAYAAGVLVSTSAGNDGPGAGTANHLSPWTMTVAASTQTREFASTLTVASTDGATFTADGASITGGAGPLPLVLSSAAPYSRPLCDAPAPSGIFAGKIVACQRGGNARVDKGFNVLQGGAAGMVLYNPTLADTETDTHWLPTVHLADGTSLLAFTAAHPGLTASFTAGAARDGQGDVMAAFSSRGPGGLFLKPDVTAPGVQILAGDTPIGEDTTSGPPGELYQAIAGTSMSSPHVAGAAILLRAAHPTWTPGQIKSALMTSARTAVVKEDLTTAADPFDMGAGRIDVGASNTVPFTMDETAARFAALGNDPLTAVHLNLPSVNAPVMPGRIDTTRVITSTSKRTITVRTSAVSPAGSRITVQPSSLTLRPGRSATLRIRITSGAPLGSQQFGTIRLNPSGGTAMHLPVAFIHTQGTVGLAQTCTPASVVRGSSATCTVTATNSSFDPAVVDVDTALNLKLAVTSATGAQITGPRSLRVRGATLTGAELGVPSVDPGVSPTGYLPLDAFGITPIAIGDEQFLTFTVPAYRFNGQTYTSIGVNSNGYLVAGGGTSADNNCCSLPAGASPAPPNNVMAPFWTDLDGTGAPGILAGTLTDGVDSWLVIEHRVNVFGTTDLQVLQTWIGVNGVQDISYAYDPGNLPSLPVGQDFLVGAENGAGEGDMASFLPTEDLVVTSTDPSPGGTLQYTFTVRGVATGPGTVTTEMRTPVVAGVTVVRSAVQVTRR